MTSLQEVWSRGGSARVAWLGLNHPFVVELMARQGFDVLCFDMQHGLVTEGDLLPMLQAATQTATPVLVRVPGLDEAGLMKMLDLGAAGVIVPLINTAQDAMDAVAACRYPPEGRRSFGPLRATLVHGQEYHLHANKHVLVFAMIETAEGLANLEAICVTPGLSGVFIGPVDLSYAIGLPPQLDNDHPDHRATVAHILATCKRHHLRTGIYSDDPAYARAYADAGVDLIVLATDTRCLSREAARKLRVFDGE
jgi:4-hydroxy-2-oxoheptanedioate aldolase